MNMKTKQQNIDKDAGSAGRPPDGEASSLAECLPEMQLDLHFLPGMISGKELDFLFALPDERAAIKADDSRCTARRTGNAYEGPWQKVLDMAAAAAKALH